MIRVVFVFNNKKIYKYFFITGHAYKSEDNNKYKLICGGISSIVFGILNTMNNLNLSQNNINVEKNSVIINNISEDIKSQTIMDVMYWSILTVRDKYPKVVKIKEKYE